VEAAQVSPKKKEKEMRDTIELDASSLADVVRAVVREELSALQTQVSQINEVIYHRKVKKEIADQGFVATVLLASPETVMYARINRAAVQAGCVTPKGKADRERWLAWCQARNLNPEKWSHSKGMFS
jgi:hypothetical protein